MTTRSLALASFVLLASCGPSEHERCEGCGMLVMPDNGWRAGADGLAFDSPKCLFRHRHRHGELGSPWVIEYYSQERRDARTLLYVAGTDLESPMGRDLVPVDGQEAAERMRTDHGGDAILRYDDVASDLVERLFR